MIKKILSFVLLLATLFSASSAWALNTQSLRYYFPGGRALSLVESKPKPKDTLTLGFGFNYGYQPLEFGNTGNTGRVSGIVDHMFTFDFNGSYSFSDRFALGINLPVHITRNLTNINSTQFETPMNLGDIMIAAQYTIIDPSNNLLNAGLGVVPFVSFPSGKLSDYVGDAHMTGGFLLVGDIDLSGHYLAANMGFRFRQEENFVNLSVASEFLYTLAYHHTILPSESLDGFVELSGATVLKDFFQKVNEAPFEGRLGVTKGFLENDALKVTVAPGVGFVNGYSNPDFRAVIKVAYDHYLPRTKKVEVVKVVEKTIPYRIKMIEKELKELTIYYPTDGDQVDPFYDQKIAGIARILKENPDLGPIYIVGHTDDVGSDKYNQRLSERRAKKAATSLIASGVPAGHIVWIGLGEAHPVVTNTSDANRALNRRTLFTYIKPAQLMEETGARGVVGINTLTGKKNDSYTEVLKELERKKVESGDNDDALVIKTYKDRSQVMVHDENKAITKDSPEATPTTVSTEGKSKKIYKKEVSYDSNSASEEAVEQESGVVDKKAKKKKSKKSKKSKKQSASAKASARQAASAKASARQAASAKASAQKETKTKILRQPLRLFTRMT
ncbi:MAG: OmpA family protein [Deltaproteobacteria bacterium]|nr:OmpA family protein [Deltaproteobacteria bacterium]